MRKRYLQSHETRRILILVFVPVKSIHSKQIHIRHGKLYRNAYD